MEAPKIIGNTIRDYRQKHRYSQEQIADYLGVDRSLISKYENGEREISLVQLARLADLFGTEMEDLIDPDATGKTVNLAFAFRNEGGDAMNEQDIKSIAAFQNVVMNYIKILKITDEKE